MRTSNTSTGVSQNVASNLRGLFWDSLRFATSKTSRCRRQHIVASHPGNDTYKKVSNQFPKILRVIHQKFTSSNIDVFWKEFLPSPFLFPNRSIGPLASPDSHWSWTLVLHNTQACYQHGGVFDQPSVKESRTEIKMGGQFWIWAKYGFGMLWKWICVKIATSNCFLDPVKESFFDGCSLFVWRSQHNNLRWRKRSKPPNKTWCSLQPFTTWGPGAPRRRAHLFGKWSHDRFDLCSRPINTWHVVNDTSSPTWSGT